MAHAGVPMCMSGQGLRGSGVSKIQNVSCRALISMLGCIAFLSGFTPNSHHEASFVFFSCVAHTWHRLVHSFEALLGV